MIATIAPATDKATRYVAIFDGKTPEDILTNDTYWVPWLNCDGPARKSLPMMAARKYLRERGGIAEGETFTLFVCVRPSMDVTVAHVTEMKVSPR